LHDVLVAFSPQTREVQFDEKWAFVGKKQQHCDPADPAATEQGDNWDHVAFDPAHRLVVSVVPGKRTAAKTEGLVKDMHRRTGGRMMDLLVSDEYPAYKPAILQTYGETLTPPRTGKPGRPKKPYIVAPADLQYATVHKTRHKGRVVHVEPRIVFGEEDAIRAALAASPVSTTLNTAFVERHHGTDRNRNGRRPARRRVSRKIGRYITRSPISRCTRTTFVGLCGPSAFARQRVGGSSASQRWPLASRTTCGP